MRLKVVTIAFSLLLSSCGDPVLSKIRKDKDTCHSIVTDRAMSYMRSQGRDPINESRELFALMSPEFDRCDAIASDQCRSMGYDAYCW